MREKMTHLPLLVLHTLRFLHIPLSPPSHAQLKHRRPTRRDQPGHRRPRLLILRRNVDGQPRLDATRVLPTRRLRMLRVVMRLRGGGEVRVDATRSRVRLPWRLSDRVGGPAVAHPWRGPVGCGHGGTVHRG